MDLPEDKIIEFLSGKAKEAWNEERPYLLSFAAPDMAANDIDYKAILNGERLKAFVERTAREGKYQIVKHPYQRAKVGVVPSGVQFQFRDDDQKQAGSSRSIHSISEQGATLFNFLKALAELPQEDLEGFVIPARVLVKLAKRG